MGFRTPDPRCVNAAGSGRVADGEQHCEPCADGGADFFGCFRTQARADSVSFVPPALWALECG